MDDRRFDSLVKALAEGRSRRRVLRGLLGLGGAAFVGGSLREPGVDAARRPTPTPRPVSCPGQQTWNGTQCVCPASAPEKCGPDCCNPGGVGADYSECCDNACCFGACYGEELCCSLENFCPGTSAGAGLCCAAGEVCCGGGSDDNACAQCCSDADCAGGVCQGGTCVCPALGDQCVSAQQCCQTEGQTLCEQVLDCDLGLPPVCCRPIGGACSGRCDCCGFLGCEGGVCCKGEGQGPCSSDSSDCCSGLVCVGPAGDNSCQLPEPPCVPLGDICDYGSNDCCLDDIYTQCNLVYSDKDFCQSGNNDVCCRTAYGACNNSCDCCVDLICENSACCQSNGGFCFNSDECCAGLTCQNDTCVFEDSTP